MYLVQWYKGYVCSEAKAKYLQDLINNAKSSVKSLWDTIGNRITKKRKASTVIQHLHHDGNIIRDDKLIANLFNNYFCGIGQKLTAKIKVSQITKLT